MPGSIRRLAVDAARSSCPPSPCQGQISERALSRQISQLMGPERIAEVLRLATEFSRRVGCAEEDKSALGRPSRLDRWLSLPMATKLDGDGVGSWILRRSSRATCR